MLHDLRFALRVLLKNRAFSAVVVVTMALGIGVNTAIFTIINSVLFKGMPFPNPGEIAFISTNRGVSYADFIDYREQSRSFKGLGAFTNLGADLSDGDVAAERVTGARITANTFSLLGAVPLVGRDFTPQDEQAGADRVVLLSYGLWQTRYSGDAGILGRTIRINLEEYTVVGVMRPGEGFPQDTRLWIPFVSNPLALRRENRQMVVFARLGEGISYERAGAELTGIVDALAEAYPETNKDLVPSVAPYTDRGTTGPIRVILYSLLGAVCFVLLIACANVANLLLSRAIQRTRETSVRTAMGASRWRIVRQLLVESVMLSVVGGVLGLGVGLLGVRWIDVATVPTGRPYWLDFSMDYRVFAYFAAVSIFTGILFGLAPALQISKSNVSENLKEGGRSGSSGKRAGRMTDVLLVGQIGLTIVLLVGAGLMIRSFLITQQFDIGVDTENLITVQVTLPASRYPQPGDRQAFQERLKERLQTVPGVDSLTIVSQAPAAGAQQRTLKIEGRDMTDANNRLPTVARLVVEPDYFDALDLSIARGRRFTETDGAPGSEAAIVNEVFAARYFENGDPLGSRIRLGEDLSRGTEDLAAPWLTIVGVSPPVYQQSPTQELRVQPTVYVPFRQEPPNAFTVLARSRLAGDAVIQGIRSELRQLDADLPLYNIRTMDDILAQRNWPYRIFGTLFGAFAVIALLISSVGIYAVTAHGVGQRTQELGVRMALGAARRDILWLVLRKGLVRIVIGMVIGVGAAAGVSRVLSSVLVNTTSTDPATFVSICLLLAAVTLLACFVPARRATRLDPVNALRTE
ncbi:MAG TPA: ABC transporter permease [Gemmatimonadaceae bacterium]|nr:ABC transporter permease [Gemmatimonadaceae bacterium]